MDYIRKFIDTDLKPVMKIWYDCNLEAHDFVPRDYWDRNFGYVSRLIPRTEVYVYETDAAVVGFVGVDDGYICGLFVKPEFRNQGIGTKLLAYLLELYDTLELNVFENNFGAVRYYENRGFVKIEETVNEDLGETEYRMFFKKKKQYGGHDGED